MLVNNCRFQDHQTETIKIMLLQHTKKFHKARDWIRLQDPATFTYQSLLNHCKLLEQCCEQFQKAQQRGRADVTTITAAKATNSSIHQDSISTHPNQTSCCRCRYSHLRGNCPAIGQNATLAVVQDTFQPYAEPKLTDVATNKAGTNKKVQATTDIAAGLQAEKAVLILGEADVLTAQADTTHTASMDHHTAQIDIGEAPHLMHTRLVPVQLQFKNPVKHQAVTLMTSQVNSTNAKTDAPAPTWKTLHLPIIQ